jgi:hypothetical protein
MPVPSIIELQRIFFSCCCPGSRRERVFVISTPMIVTFAKKIFLGLPVGQKYFKNKRLKLRIGK